MRHSPLSRHARAASLSLVAALGLSSSLAHAELFSLGAETYDVQFVAGTGPNKAILQLDFNSDGSYLFAYQWNASSPNGRTLLSDLQSAPSGITFTDTYFPDYFSYLVNTIHYNALTPPDDYPNNFWYWFTSLDGQTWSESWVGYSDTALTNGGFYAFALQNTDPNFPDYLGYPASNYPDALEPVAGNIPEPATLSLLGLSLIALITKRRAQQR